MGSWASSNRRGPTTLSKCLSGTGVLILLVSLCLSAHAQSNEWVWMGGGNTGGRTSTYGTMGTAAAGNVPGSRIDASTWTDLSGNLWLFGGEGLDIKRNQTYLNDLWEFNSATNAWAWVGGSMTGSQPGVYGTLGTAAAGNVPGGREMAADWTDSSGNLWLFGGWGLDGNGGYGYLNDLWEFNPSIGQWTWQGGSSTAGSKGGQSGVYGTLGTAGAGNIPGGRLGASNWSDAYGNFWLFGGYGFDANGLSGYLNDLWEFNPSANVWTWISGLSTLRCNSSNCSNNPPGVYGTLGTAAAGNLPGGRVGASSWTDSSGAVWIFGGWGYDSKSQAGNLNDVWEFNPSTDQWAWMGGSSTLICSTAYRGTCSGQPGIYGTLWTPAAGDLPGNRGAAVSVTDSSGGHWLFGGYGFDAKGNWGYLNDLWEFNSSMNQWTWMGGSSTVPKVNYGRSGVYGTLGKPATRNIPGGRNGDASWADVRGNLWIFGGWGVDANGNQGWLNDLWEYLPPGGSLPSAAMPTFSEPGGTHTSMVTVSLADTTSGASIYYTLDGSTPSNQSAKYGSGISIARTTTVKAIAEASGFATSAVASATCTVLKAQTITLTKPATPVTYGAKPIPLSATAGSGLAVTFSVVSGPAKVSGSTLTITGAGTVVVGANQAGNTTYGAAPQVTSSMTVNKAKLTVTATNLTMKKGATVPALTYTMAGFVNSDTQATATTGKPALSTTATAQSAAGSYPITVKAGTLAAGSYTFTLVTGTLTVTK